MAKPIAETWYGIDPCPGGVLRLRETHVDPYMSGDVWLVRGSGRDLVVDSGMGILPPGPVIAGLSDKPILAVALCSYYDHAGGMYSFENRLCHSLDADAIAQATDPITALVSDDRVSGIALCGLQHSEPPDDAGPADADPGQATGSISATGLSRFSISPAGRREASRSGRRRPAFSSPGRRSS